MAALVIKKLPDPIHKALKARAKANRRSMTQEAVATLARAFQPSKEGEAGGVFVVSDVEQTFEYENPRGLKRPPEARKVYKVVHPEPVKLGFKITDASIRRAIREGRD